MFQRGEEETCPHCDVPLAAFETLPRSHDAELEEEAEPVAPEDEPLKKTDMGRGKGPTLALGLLGLGLFFVPWVTVTLPNEAVYSGFDLARKLGWVWGAACAWVVLVPTVLSRQTIAQLRGARLVATFLSIVPSLTVGLVFASSPHRDLVPVRFSWMWPMYATLLVSAVAAFVSVRLGGRVDDVKVTSGTSQGQVLH